MLPVDRATLSDTDQSTVTVGVRPEDLELVGDEQGIAVEVDVVEELGADAFIYGRRAGSDDEKKTARGNVALVAARALADPRGTAGKFIEFSDGDTPIAEALENLG